jgi:ATP-dependent protease ClpP protease subunit
MTRINLDGVVGWEVLAADIRAALEAAAGDDIDLTISSPGGSVYEGLAIYNAIRDYRRDGGKVTARVIGLAASMATYIPLAADEVIVEDNAVWMIHNPWSIALGDQNDMRKEADILEGIAGVLASAYVKKTEWDRQEIRSMMDAETYLFGDDIVAFGFADRVEPAGDGAEDRDEAVAMARTEVEAMKHTMKQEPERQQLDKAAAMIKAEIPAVGRAKSPAEKAENTGVPMDKELLKKEHSAVYDEVHSDGIKAGVEQERARQKDLDAQLEADPGNVKLAELIAEAKATGKTVAEIQTRIIVAVRDGKLDGENPPHVETEPAFDHLTDDDREAAERMGVSLSEYSELIKEVK